MKKKKTNKKKWLIGILIVAGLGSLGYCMLKKSPVKEVYKPIPTGHKIKIK